MECASIVLQSCLNSSLLTTGDSIIKCVMPQRSTNSARKDMKDFTIFSKEMFGEVLFLIKLLLKPIAGEFQETTDLVSMRISSIKANRHFFRVFTKVETNLCSESVYSIYI